MDRKLRGREPKDQPSSSRIDRVETEDASQKRAIGVCIFAEEHEVSSENHGPMLINEGNVRKRRVALQSNA